jgi:hypothetical protein
LIAHKVLKKELNRLFEEGKNKLNTEGIAEELEDINYNDNSKDEDEENK